MGHAGRRYQRIVSATVAHGAKHLELLSAKAERATQEIYALEQAIASDPSAQRLVGVPRTLGKLLAPGTSANSLRTLRFDFHPTLTGWLLSEVHTNVPGGWGEASALPALFKAFQTQVAAPGSPLTAWSAAVAAEVEPGHVARLAYRSVPLYNACLYPTDVAGGSGVPAVIEVLPIMRALEREKDTL